MISLPRSSGDPIADRRADYAEMLFADGKHAAAAELMLGAMELAPHWVLGWFRLGEFHEAAGQVAQAVLAWRMALRLDPDDRPGAGLKLHLVGAAPPPDAPPSAFVEALFDEYAGSFDEKLVGALGYRAPGLLEDAIRAAAPGRRFGLAIDLGCGTGLMGAALRPWTERLEGHDISAAMLRKAKARGVYDALRKSDLQALALTPDAADLITAADVLIYVGLLERLFASVAAGLAPGGLFAFTVEVLDGEPWRLRETRRYAHSEPYVRGVLDAVGLAPVSLQRATIRTDRGVPVEGLVVVARKPFTDASPD